MNSLADSLAASFAGYLRLRSRAPHLVAVAAAAVAAAVLGACTTTSTREAPIVDKSTRAGAKPEAARAPIRPVEPAPALTREARDGSYVVQRGDTLYSIALAFGQDFRDLARWNGIDDPARIAVGQALRVVAPDGDNAAAAPGVASTVPIQPIGSVESRPLASAPAPVPLPPVSGSGSAAPSAAPPVPVVAASGPVVSSGASAASSTPTPSGPTSGGMTSGSPAPAAGAAATTTPGGARPTPTAPAAPPAPVAPVVSAGNTAATRPTDPASEIAKAAPKPAPSVADSALGWAWPASGKVIEEFHETRNKGIDISGKEGDAVLAAGDGQIVYSGSGLRGYGNLVIIKHTDDYISAYAHNKQILVKQGQAVKRGQRIAELGKSDADTPKLHFEIRRQGKPVDPLKYLPAR